MKKRIVFLYCIFAINQQSKAEQLTRQINVNPQQSIASFHYMSGISRSDFRSGGQSSLLTTYTITTPGTYTFVQDIGFEGRSNATSHGGNTALFINSSNVVIDLGGKTLYQNNSTSNTKGIEVAEGKYNITIKNGNISGFKDSGIYVRKRTNSIRIQDVVIANCAKRGITFAGRSNSALTDNNNISNCLIQNTLISDTTGISGSSNAVGLQLDHCYNILVKQSLFGHSTAGTLATPQDAIGVLVESCTHVVFDHCDASGNYGEAAYGFKISGTTTGATTTACSFIECSANGNFGLDTSTSGFGYGFYAKNINSCLWDKCQANGNQGTSAGYGFYYDTVKYSATKNCEAWNNNGGSAGDSSEDGAFGFYSVSGTSNMWKECTSIGQQSISASTAVMCNGFDLRLETNSHITQCESRSNGNNSTAPWGVGIHLTETTDCTIDDCSVMNNKSDTANHGVGIRDTNPESSTLVTSCLLFNNGTDSSIQNFHVSYASPGEFNITTTIDQGGVGALLTISPYQNVSITN